MGGVGPRPTHYCTLNNMDETTGELVSSNGETKRSGLGPFHWIFISILLLTVFYVCLKVFRRRRSILFVLRHDMTKGHRWLSTEFIDKPTYCNSCMQCCGTGSSCEVCGLCVCTEKQCLQTACSTNTCKPLSTIDQNHTWIKGNLPLASKCFKCLSPCGTVPALVDYRCLWCHSTVHEDCIENEPRKIEQICSLGAHKRLIIPPNCVTVENQQDWRGKRRVVIKEVTVPTDIEDWRPLIVLSNTRSGGKDGEAVMSVLRRLLNPVQVP